MAEDIVPGLLDAIKSDFQILFDENPEIAKLYAKVNAGTATYLEAHGFAIEVGETLAAAFAKNLSSDVLPDGKMYYNIAERIISPMLENNHDLVADISTQIQTALNEQGGIGIKAIRPELNHDRIEGIVNKVSSAEQYDDVAWVLSEPVVNFTQSVVDATVRVNADFQYKAGLRPKIIRRAEGKCCKWCAKLAGTYAYEDVKNTGNDVFRRHERCRCIVDYRPGEGKRVQDVWSKNWHSDADDDKIIERKTIGLSDLTDTDRVALNQYKSFESYLLNEALRDGYDLSSNQKVMLERLDRALEKLPAYEGTTYRSIDSRNVRNPDAFWEKYQVGNLVSERAYTSTSVSVYDDALDIQMIITGKSGRDLRVYTDLEQEIVYPRGTEFIVTKREGTTIWLEEI